MGRAEVLIVIHPQMVLHDVADFEDRKQFLESLKDRLEALVAPKLIAAFNSHSSGTCLPVYYPVICEPTFTILGLIELPYSNCKYSHPI